MDLTSKQLIESGITPKIVMTFRGNASYFTQTNLAMVKEGERADALKVAAKIALGAYQHKGYAYIAP